MFSHTKHFLGFLSNLWARLIFLLVSSEQGFRLYIPDGILSGYRLLVYDTPDKKFLQILICLQVLNDGQVHDHLSLSQPTTQ